jgi:hypothetical protein
VVLSAVAVPTALALNSSPAAGASQDASRGGGGGGGGGNGCSYPSNRTPALTLSANPSTIKRGAATTLSGTMTANGCPIKDAKVGLYAQPAGTSPSTLVDTRTTNKDGVFSFAQKPGSTTTYQVVFAGTTSYGASSSNTVTVTVTAK